MMIPRSLQKRILEQAFRAPSVHNIQSWLLSFKNEGLILYDDLSRVLHVGDPQLHDHEVSMGAFVEGLRLLLSTEGFGFSEVIPLPKKEIHFRGKVVRERFLIKVTTGFNTEPLATQIPLRKSFRGKFQKTIADDIQSLRQILTTKHSLVVTDPKELATWATVYDESALRGNAQSSYQEELFSWLRLSHKHADYSRDGLNREALSLSWLEGLFANVLMKPGVYRKLNKMGIAKTLISETPQILSSAGLLVIFKPEGASPLESGALFYQLWLELTRVGFYACPMSSLVDDKIGKAFIEESCKRKNPLNVLRVGRAPNHKVYTSPRLELESKILGGAYES